MLSLSWTLLASGQGLPMEAHAASIVLYPGAVALPTGGTRSFAATVSGLSGKAVTWEVNGQQGGSAQSGFISASGVYSAPSSIVDAPTTVTVTARAVADPAVTASAAVTVRHPIPWLTTVTPTAVPVGIPFTVDIVGSRFVAGATAALNGSPMSTTWLDSTHLRASANLAPSQIGALNLVVLNPGAVSSVVYTLVGVPPGSPGSPDPQTLSAVRFLEQATFGPTDAAIVEVGQIGIDAWIEAQMDPAVTPPSTLADGLTVQQVGPEVFRQMAMAPDQLRQRVTFALSQLFVVSMFKNTNGYELIPWQRLLARNAFGNFRTLLEEVTLSPTMGKYLDLVGSRKPTVGNLAGANENYAREVLQLFTIGLYKMDQNGSPILDEGNRLIPTYDQEVVRNVALAFTGWVYPTSPGGIAGPNNPPNFHGSLIPWEANHDRTSKTIFDGIVIPAGMSAAAEMDLVLDHIFEHANVPPFIATRLIRALVTSNPSPEYIGRVADVFVDNGDGVRGDLAAVVTAILTDDEARNDAPDDEEGHLKDPVLHSIGLLRALGGQVIDAGQVMYLFAGLGEQVLASPSVFSFYSPLAALPGRPDLFGPEFQIFTPALAIQRAAFLYNLVSGQFGTAFKFDIAPWVAAAPDPVNLVNLIDVKLFHGRMTPMLRQSLLGASYPVTDPKQRAIGALYLTAISSEYSVIR